MTSRSSYHQFLKSVAHVCSNLNGAVMKILCNSLCLWLESLVELLNVIKLCLIVVYLTDRSV
jgi:hypothetical protein